MLRHRSVLVLACVVAVACAGAADAKTYRVAGKQIVVDEDQGTSKMRGGLIGGWTITGFEPLETQRRLPRARDRDVRGLPGPPPRPLLRGRPEGDARVHVRLLGRVRLRGPRLADLGHLRAPDRQGDRRLRRRARRHRDGRHADAVRRPDPVRGHDHAARPARRAPARQRDAHGRPRLRTCLIAGCVRFDPEGVLGPVP